MSDFDAAQAAGWVEVSPDVAPLYPWAKSTAVSGLYWASLASDGSVLGLRTRNKFGNQRLSNEFNDDFEAYRTAVMDELGAMGRVATGELENIDGRIMFKRREPRPGGRPGGFGGPGGGRPGGFGGPRGGDGGGFRPRREGGGYGGGGGGGFGGGGGGGGGGYGDGAGFGGGPGDGEFRKPWGNPRGNNKFNDRSRDRDRDSRPDRGDRFGGGGRPDRDRGGRDGDDF